MKHQCAGLNLSYKLARLIFTLGTIASLAIPSPMTLLMIYKLLHVNLFPYSQQQLENYMFCYEVAYYSHPWIVVLVKLSSNKPRDVELLVLAVHHTDACREQIRILC